MVFNVVLWLMTGVWREPQTWTWMAIWGLLDIRRRAGDWDIKWIRRRAGDWDIKWIRRRAGDWDIEWIRKQAADWDSKCIRRRAVDWDIKRIRRQAGDWDIKWIRRRAGAWWLESDSIGCCKSVTIGLQKLDKRLNKRTSGRLERSREQSTGTGWSPHT